MNSVPFTNCILPQVHLNEMDFINRQQAAYTGNKT